MQIANDRKAIISVKVGKSAGYTVHNITFSPKPNNITFTLFLDLVLHNGLAVYLSCEIKM